VDLGAPGRAETHGEQNAYRVAKVALAALAEARGIKLELPRWT